VAFIATSRWTQTARVVCETIMSDSIPGVRGIKVNIPEGRSIGHSKQKSVYEHVSNSERFPN
jgi:hypothetical protein